MQSQIHEVGAFEAKTKLSELLRETERGSSFVIMRRGKAVGRLVPPDGSSIAPNELDFAAAFREIRESIEGPVDIRSLIENGRR